MSHRTVLGLKLAVASICFLALTIASAVGLRALTGYPDQRTHETKSGFTTGIDSSVGDQQLETELLGESAPDSDREPASFKSRSKTLVFEPKSKLTFQELSLVTSSKVSRGQKVSLNLSNLLDPEAVRPRTVALNLFPDTTVNVELQAPSVYGVNSGLLVGLVQGDSESFVRIMVQNGVVDGTIRFKGREFRVFDGGNGLHIVTEGPAL